jgi:O-antigen/teichoic acid export membrane protein
VHTGFRKNSFIYVGTNFLGKGLAALAQLYAIYIFTKMQSKEDAALIFLLLGYAIWFQLFELGLSQTIQNKFNARLASTYLLLKTILAHYGILIVISTVVVLTPYLAKLLLSNDATENNVIGVKVFSIGASILILASSNTIIQRFLLVMNKGNYGNFLVIIQSFLAILGLFIYQYINKPNLLVAVLVYLSPQVFVYLPILFLFFLKAIRKKNKKEKEKEKISSIAVDAFGFSGISFLSIIFLGADYYFVAHYLNADEIISYYLVSRIFFVSYIIYYGYVLHQCKRLYLSNNTVGIEVIDPIIKNTLYVGMVCVICIYSLAALLNLLNIFDNITNGIELSQRLLFFGFLYFLVRVARDIILVIIAALNKKSLLYKAYIIEVIIGLGGMYLVAPTYKGLGIFSTLFFACLLSFIFVTLSLIRNKKNEIIQKNV